MAETVIWEVHSTAEKGVKPTPLLMKQGASQGQCPDRDCSVRAKFAALRIRVADGSVVSGAQHLPGEAAWLVCEPRVSGERKYYLTNYAEDVSLESLAALIKARWVCEQAHQQLKEELGLDHFEGRNWLGLHHHVPIAMMAFAFLQHLRLGEKTRPARDRRPSRLCHRYDAVSSPL